MLIQQARDLHVRIHFVYLDIHRECMQGTFVYVCVASLFSVLLINCQRYLVPIRAGVIMEFTHAQMRTYNKSIRRKCHMIAESAQPRNPSNVTRPFSA